MGKALEKKGSKEAGWYLWITSTPKKTKTNKQNQTKKQNQKHLQGVEGKGR